MRIATLAVGRLKAGAERDLCERYRDRAGAAGRRLGLTFALHEIAESRAGSADLRKEQEAGAILARVPRDGARLVALDEHGSALDSARFAERLRLWRDGGAREVAIAIGGADGLGAAVLTRADLRLAFGAMTWPHQLVRIMLAEQLYRAVTILSGHPYHRD
jgi:23S rRNA (pseudouridine1915-N3)-methyltransferase